MRHRIFHRTAGMALLLCCLVDQAYSRDARANPPVTPATTTDVDAQVRRLYDEGLKAAKANRWEQARRSFADAWALKRTLQVLPNLGRAELMSGRYVDAAVHLTLFVKEASDLGPDDRKAIQEVLDRAKAKVGTVSFSVNQPGAEIFVDGKSVGKAPLGEAIFVQAGMRVFEARLPGFMPAREDKSLPAGAATTVQLTLTQIPSIQAKNEPASNGPNKLLIVGGGVAGVALVAMGSAFAVLWNTKSDASKDHGDLSNSPNPIAFQDLQRQSATWGTASAVSFAVGGAALSGTLIYYIATRKSPQATKSGSNVLFYPGAHQASVVFAVPW